MFTTKLLTELKFRYIYPGAFVLLTLSQGNAADSLNFCYKKADLARVKQAIIKNEFKYMPAVIKLRKEADSALATGPWSVVTKDLYPPSGNKHDYMSNGKYWWPDPENPDGPYIRKDGVTNPHTRTTDKDYMSKMADAVETLALAYYFFDQGNFAEKAVENIRVWFLNPDTYMSPHMQYGQAIPNRSEGRPFGIIETRKLIRVLDAVQLLKTSGFWTTTDQAGIERWFRQYLDWLLTSDHGKREGTNGNNHETAYTFQVASYALFLGDTVIARQKLDKHFKQNIIFMIEPDGRQPRELKRTKSLHYSAMNLGLMVHLCQLADYLALDLWHYQTEDGRSIIKAFDFLYPVWAEKKEWAYQQIEISDPDYDDLFHVLRVMRLKFGNDEYEATLKQIYGTSYMSHRGQLYWPLLDR